MKSTLPDDVDSEPNEKLSGFSKTAMVESRKTLEELRRKYSGNCAFDRIDNVYYPRKCEDAPVVCSVTFANGPTLNLCESHRKWYEEIHPIAIPIVAKTT